MFFSPGATRCTITQVTENPHNRCQAVSVLTAAISVTGPFWCRQGRGGAERRWRSCWVKSFQFMHLRKKIDIWIKRKRTNVPQMSEFRKNYILCQHPVNRGRSSYQILTQNVVSGYSAWLGLGWWSWNVEEAPLQPWESIWPGGGPGLCYSGRWAQRCGSVQGFCPQSTRVFLKPPESSESLHDEKQCPQKLWQKHLAMKGKIIKLRACFCQNIGIPIRLMSNIKKYPWHASRAQHLEAACEQ